MIRFCLFCLCLIVLGAVSSCHEEDPYANLDRDKMSLKEISETCLSINDPDVCDNVGGDKPLGCAYPETFKRICLNGSQCVIEQTPGYCMDDLSQRGNLEVTPETIIYKKSGGQDAIFFHYTVGPYGWSRCLGAEDGAPEVCKCAGREVPKVEGECP
jgi:hypothetical protein